MTMVRPMSEASRRWPCSSRTTSSSNSRPTRSASSPSMVISLPRTTMRTPGKASSTNRSNSSRWPSRPTMRWLPGTRILTGVALTPAGPGHGGAHRGRGGGDGGPTLFGVLADVEHEPVAAARRCPRPRPPAGPAPPCRPPPRRRPGSDGGGVVDVAPGDDEDVHGAWGFRSRKATEWSERSTMSAGSSPATMRQKMQSPGRTVSLTESLWPRRPRGRRPGSPSARGRGARGSRGRSGRTR
jgi:hypothetical protein